MWTAEYDIKCLILNSITRYFAKILKILNLIPGSFESSVTKFENYHMK